MIKFNKYNGSFNVVGSNIKIHRKKNNISQEDLCARLQVLGFQIYRTDISKIENNSKFVSDFEVLGFAKALKIPIEKLYAGINLSNEEN